MYLDDHNNVNLSIINTLFVLSFVPQSKPNSENNNMKG